MARFLYVITFLCAGAIHAAAQTPAASLAQECLRLNSKEIDWSDHPVADKHRVIALETCRQAYAANPDDPKIKIALAR